MLREVSMLVTAASGAAAAAGRTLIPHGAGCSGGGGGDDTYAVESFFQFLRTALRTFGGGVVAGKEEFKFGTALLTFVTEDRHSYFIPCLLTRSRTVLRPRRPVRVILKTLPRSSTWMSSAGVVLRARRKRVLLRLCGCSEFGA